MDSIAWEQKTVEEVLKKLSVGREGLSESEVKKRREQYGKNVFKGGKHVTVPTLLLLQLKSPIVIILLCAGILTLLLGHHTDSFVIFATFLLNIGIGLIQEYKASSSFQALKKTIPHKALVRRDGKDIIISTDELVVGDIVVLKTGAYVPADLRIINERDLSTNEAALTGEWSPVPKHSVAMSASNPVHHRWNISWKGSTVVGGEGVGVVIRVGGQTRLGVLASYLDGKDNTRTPLQVSITRLSELLLLYITVAVLCILLFGIYQHIPVSELIFIAAAVAVAAIPSGLPTVITMVLAVGMTTILKNGGLARNLLAAETLGTTTWILADKTGTLTEGRMSLMRAIEGGGREYTFSKDTSDQYAERIVMQALLASGGEIVHDKDGKDTELIGTPIEKSIVRVAQTLGIERSSLSDTYKDISYLSFSSKRRFSAAIASVSGNDARMIYILGSPEVIIDASTHYKIGEETKYIDKAAHETLTRILHDQAHMGGRVIALAMKETEQTHFDEEHGAERAHALDACTFVAFLVLEDPVRATSATAIDFIHRAHIKVTMVTGDNQGTALSVSKKVGIIESWEDGVITGDVFAELTDADVLKKAESVRVFARMLPEQKLRLLKLLQQEGEVVAMTGDGINDAPSLKNASIGIALGSGTDVAKDASDIVLVKNDFSTITKAIIEGRRIIGNLKKVVVYLLSTSFSEVILIACTLLFALPLPLLPAQILWANIIEEAFIGFAFAFEKGDKKLIEKKPAKIHARSIITKSVKKSILYLSLVTGLFLFTLYVGLIIFAPSLSIEEIRTIVFVALSIDSIFFALSLKSLTQPIWKVNIFDNMWLIYAMGISIGFLVLAFNVPFLKTVLGLTSLPSLAYILIPCIGFFHITLIEYVKLLLFKKREMLTVQTDFDLQQQNTHAVS